MSWSIEFSPLVPMFFLQVAGLVALALAALLLYRRQRGALLRIATLATLLAALANPTLKQEQREPLSNIAVVLLDRSMSQIVAGRVPRMEAVRQALQERFAKIDNLEVRFLDAALPSGDAHDRTDLFEALNGALADIPVDRLAGVVMVTDGQVHDVPTSAAGLGFEAPLHALITGAEDEFDRRIETITAPKFSLVGSSGTASIAVRSSGPAGRRDVPATLTIRREGRADETLTVGVGQPLNIEFPFPHVGTNILEIELQPVPGELTLANNRLVLTAEGVRENLRVLLVSGEPHAGERTWRNLLKSDAAVDLVHFTILRPPQKQDGTPIHQLSLIQFPHRELFQEKLDEFDLIIFDRYQRRGVLPLIYLDNISRYVEETGGAVLVAAGTDYAEPQSLYRSPLSQVLPAEPTGQVIDRPFKPGITETGKLHPVTRGLPGSPAAGVAGAEPSWGRWFRLIDSRDARGEVVMDGPDKKPLLVLDRRGKGRVALLLSDHAWLWARGLEGGGPHTDLLRRLAHWLMKEPDLEEEKLSAIVHGNSITIERRTLGDSIAPVTMRAPDGEVSEFVLGKTEAGFYSTTIEVKEPGIHRLTSDDLSAIANVGSGSSREVTDVVATSELLGPVIDETGGGSYWTAPRGSVTAARPGAAAAGTTSTPEINLPRISMLGSARIMHGSGWLGLRERDAYVVRGIRLIPLFTGLLALCGLLALMAAMWWREGR